jgi:hypothetical protein
MSYPRLLYYISILLYGTEPPGARFRVCKPSCTPLTSSSPLALPYKLARRCAHRLTCRTYTYTFPCNLAKATRTSIDVRRAFFGVWGGGGLFWRWVSTYPASNPLPRLSGSPPPLLLSSRVLRISHLAGSMDARGGIEAVLWWW